MIRPLAMAGFVLAVSAMFYLSPPVAQAAEPNLIVNPSLETSGTDGLPQGWHKDSWGTNMATFDYPVTGHASAKAAQTTLISRTSGDAKWWFDHVPVTPGAEYRFSDWYQASSGSQLVIQYRTVADTFEYVWLKDVPSASVWTEASAVFTVPGGVSTLTVFHLVSSVGSLTIDEAALQATSSAPPTPPPSFNLITNPSLEIAAGTLPQAWNKNASSGVTAAFTYPAAPSHDGNKAAAISVSAYSSGDAKWWFNTVAATPQKQYRFSDWYQSTVPTTLTAQFLMSNGTITYKWLKDLPASGGWSKSTSTFIAPNGISRITVFHSIKSVGSLTVDQFSLEQLSGSPSFNQPMVSLDFDDGHRNVLLKALPILNQANFKSTQYIVTNRLNSPPEFMTTQDILNLQSMGHEISAHTRTHSDLTTMSATQLQAEISGSRQDLLNIGMTPVKAFAYPFGAYNSTVRQAVMNAGFSGARSTNGGYNDRTTDRFVLNRQGMYSTTTFAQVKGWIDTARAYNQWLILLFHDVHETPTDQYTVTPAMVQQVVDYLVSTGTTVVTATQGLAMME